MAKRHFSRKAAILKFKTTISLISALILFSSATIADSDIEKFAVTATSSGQTPTQLSYSVSGSSSWYPYYIADSADSPGILSELIPKLLALAHVEGQKLTLPPKRTNKGLETGLLDFDIVSPSWFEHGDFGPLFVQSIPIMAITEHLITLEKNADKWQVLEQIKGNEIGTVRGYLYHDDALFTRVDFTSEQELIKALHKDRIQVAISGDYPALYWSKQLNLPIKLGAVHSNGDLVMRLRKERQDLLPAINQAINTLKADGTIDKIIAKYTQSIVIE